MEMDGLIPLQIGLRILLEMLTLSLMIQHNGVIAMVMGLETILQEIPLMSALANMAAPQWIESVALMPMVMGYLMLETHSLLMEHNGRIETAIIAAITL